MKRDSDLVWSSEEGDLRRNQENRKAPKRGNRKATADSGRAPAGSTMKVKRETSGRKGKTVTTISEIPLSEADTRALARRLKQHCGVGGSSRGSIIELQGDHRDKVISFLGKEGHRAVPAGG